MWEQEAAGSHPANPAIPAVQRFSFESTAILVLYLWEEDARRPM
jgi:hypothetical protein